MEYRFLTQTRIEDTINLLLIFQCIGIALFFVSLVAWTRNKKWHTISSISAMGSALFSAIVFSGAVALSSINPYDALFTDLEANRLQYILMACGIVAVIIGIALVTTGLVWKKKKLLDEQMRISALALQGLLLFLAGMSVIILQFR